MNSISVFFKIKSAKYWLLKAVLSVLFAFLAASSVHADLLEGAGFRLRLGGFWPKNSLNDTIGIDFKEYDQGKVRYPATVSFPKNTFANYFFGSLAMDIGSASNSFKTDNGDRFISAEEKTALCPDNVSDVFPDVDPLVTENRCSLSARFSEQNIKFGFTLGFMGFPMGIGSYEARWLEIGSTFLYMLMQYDLEVSICLTTRDDLYSGRFNNDGTCSKDSALVDESSGQVYLPGVGANVVLLTISAPTRTFSFVEFETFQAQAFELTFENHPPLELNYKFISVNLVTYTMIF